MSLWSWIKGKLGGDDEADRRRRQRIIELEREWSETNARKQRVSNFMTLWLVTLLVTLYRQNWRISAFSVAEIAVILIALRSVFYQRERMKAISAELEKLKSRVTYASEGGIAGLLLGMCGGAYVGGGAGIAAGPLGAVAGTIPGAILGGVVFMLTGHIVGAKCTKSRGSIGLSAGPYLHESPSSHLLLPPARRATNNVKLTLEEVKGLAGSDWKEVWKEYNKGNGSK